MYSTCLYCTKDLGANEVIETLPIGRRIAFDERQGRLWVVCRSCEKWNLVPFDTRLETIDECERLFSQTRVRFSTDNIGIARLSEGLELVRVGPAQRPEFAAWRYGDQFGRRRRLNAVKMVGVAGAGVAVVVAHRLLLPVLGAGMTFQYFNVANTVYRQRRAVLQITGEDGVRGVMTPSQIKKARIVPADGDGWTLVAPTYDSARGGFATGWRARDAEFEGQQAIEVLGRMLPRVNRSGASTQQVRDAVDVLEQGSTVRRVLQNDGASHVSSLAARVGFIMAARLAANRPPPAVPVPVPAFQGRPWSHSSYYLSELPATARLALEMLAHEDTERMALAGELKLLERQWQEAEEVAKIADSLAVPDDVDREVGGARGARG